MRVKILILIFIGTFLVRFWHLGQNPPSLNWDEIAIGYNAYSLLQTGKDEFGTPWPTIFRSFDDYKSPAYIYTTVLSILLFGKTEFAVRFASAFFGSLTVVIFYFFVRRILQIQNHDDSKNSIIWHNRQANMALLATFMLAITPWHLHFSRVAFEANFALFWEVLGAWLFLRYIKQSQQFRDLLLAVLAWSVALYSYANARLFIALLLFGWTIYYFKTIRTHLKHFLAAGVIAIELSSILILQMAQGIGLARYQATSITNRPEIYQRNNALAKEDFDNGQGRLSAIIHNYRIPLAMQILDNYLSHFSYSFLFLKADLPRHQIPGYGLLLPWQLPLIIIGLLFTVKNRRNIQASPILWWLVIAPIAAALTWQVPHAIRSELLLPAFSLAAGVGAWALVRWVQAQDLKMYSFQPQNEIQKFIKPLLWSLPKIAFFLILTVMITAPFLLAINYSTRLPQEFSQYWLYGRKEMVDYVLQEKPKYNKVIISLEVEWAYLWFLWYGPYTPQQYLSMGGTVSGGFEETQNKIDNIEFHPFPFDSGGFTSRMTEKNTIYIGVPKEFPSGLVPDKIIYDLSGKPIIYIVKT